MGEGVARVAVVVAPETTRKGTKPDSDGKPPSGAPPERHEGHAAR